VLLRYRLLAGIAAVAAGLTAAVFVFARPEYRTPGGGQTLGGTGYPAPDEAADASGWRWSHGQPGFTPRTGHERWNIAEVGEHELDAPRLDARLSPARPETVKLLAAQRTGPRTLNLLLSGTDRHGATCVGAAVAGQPTRYFCPSSLGDNRLGDQVAFVIASARPAFASRGSRGFPLFLEAATRGDVTRVVATAPELRSFVHHDGSRTTRWTTRQEIYHRKGWGWWGTFDGTLSNGYPRSTPRSPWRVRLDFFDGRRLLVSAQVRLDAPGERLFAVTP